MEMNREDRHSLEALLDEIEHLSDRKNDQRVLSAGSDVYLNIYDMVTLTEQNVSVNILILL